MLALLMQTFNMVGRPELPEWKMSQENVHRRDTLENIHKKRFETGSDGFTPPPGGRREEENVHKKCFETGSDGFTPPPRRDEGSSF